MKTDVFRQRDGNLQNKSVATPQEMESAKAEGWKTAAELWPKPETKEKK
jgi:hypothetical protein